MIAAWRLARVGLHLGYGMATAALVYPLVGRPAQLKLKQRWSRQLLGMLGRAPAGGGGAAALADPAGGEPHLATPGHLRHQRAGAGRLRLQGGRARLAAHRLAVRTHRNGVHAARQPPRRARSQRHRRRAPAAGLAGVGPSPGRHHQRRQRGPTLHGALLQGAVDAHCTCSRWPCATRMEKAGLRPRRRIAATPRCWNPCAGSPRRPACTSASTSCRRSTAATPSGASWRRPPGGRYGIR